MYFKPWRFGDEDELLKNFFASLVKQVDQSLSGVKTFINEWKEVLKVAPYVGGAAEKIVGKLTFQGLEEFKRKTESILKKSWQTDRRTHGRYRPTGDEGNSIRFPLDQAHCQL
jgi:hypothetical protein